MKVRTGRDAQRLLLLKAMATTPRSRILGRVLVSVDDSPRQWWLLPAVVVTRTELAAGFHVGWLRWALVMAWPRMSQIAPPSKDLEVPEKCPNCGHPSSGHAEDSRVVGCQAGNGSEEQPLCGCRVLPKEMSAPLRPDGLPWPSKTLEAS